MIVIFNPLRVALNHNRSRRTSHDTDLVIIGISDSSRKFRVYLNFFTLTHGFVNYRGIQSKVKTNVAPLVMKLSFVAIDYIQGSNPFDIYHYIQQIHTYRLTLHDTLF